MTSPISMLRAEHETALSVLSEIERVAARISDGTAVSPQFVEAVGDFLSLYIHRLHRDKEEDHLVAMLRRSGMHSSSSCVVELLAEHADGERAFTKMDEAAQNWASGDESARNRWLSAFQTYAENLRYHLRREEQVVFMMAESALTDDQRAELNSAFHAIDERAERAEITERIAAARKTIEQEAHRT